MKDLIISIFGTYEPIMYEIENANGTLEEIVPSGMAGVDIPFVCGVFIFAIAFYSVFRMLGSIIAHD